MSDPETHLPDFARHWVNLAQPRLGARALACSDDFFAPMERMLDPTPPVFIADKYDDHGKWMDGWESRRKREPGHDWCVVRLGLPGVIKGVDIDTSHFTGNYPPAAALEACLTDHDPDDATEWVEILPEVTLGPSAPHFHAIDDARPWSHVRLNIFPDGGVARLRVYGQVQIDWSARDPAQEVDLAALVNGGRGLACNDQHFGKPENVLAPGKGENMGDGWETRRRREPGHDWAVFALGHRGQINSALIDTAFFKGNYPDRCSLEAVDLADTNADPMTASGWQTLLPEQKLRADSEHSFDAEVANIGPVTHVRLNIFPDGGISRMRLRGTIAP